MTSQGTSQYANNLTSTTSGTAGSSGLSHGGSATSNPNPVKNVVAGIHGVGEKVRGEFNAGVDRAFGEDSSKGVRTAASGDREMQTGQFSRDTKAREGVQAGRHQVANSDLNRE